jgi:hypothetical protein
LLWFYICIFDKRPSDLPVAVIDNAPPETSHQSASVLRVRASAARIFMAGKGIKTKTRPCLFRNPADAFVVTRSFEDGENCHNQIKP